LPAAAHHWRFTICNSNFAAPAPRSASTAHLPSRYLSWPGNSGSEGYCNGGNGNQERIWDNGRAEEAGEVSEAPSIGAAAATLQIVSSSRVLLRL
jgi:hypothetical protein